MVFWVFVKLNLYFFLCYNDKNDYVFILIGIGILCCNKVCILFRCFFFLCDVILVLEGFCFKFLGIINCVGFVLDGWFKR